MLSLQGVLDLLESSHQEAFPSALKPQSLGGAETHCGTRLAKERGQEGAGQETCAVGKFFLALMFLAFSSALSEISQQW